MAAFTFPPAVSTDIGLERSIYRLKLASVCKVCGTYFNNYQMFLTHTKICRSLTGKKSPHFPTPPPTPPIPNNFQYLPAIYGNSNSISTSPNR